jgi:GAF domain-containing protein
MQDIELLGLFARQAALAIDQAQSIENIDEVLLLSLRRLASVDPAHPLNNLLSALGAKPDAGRLNDLMRVSDLLNEFSRMGESEREMALKILDAFAEYSQSQRKMSMGGPWR